MAVRNKQVNRSTAPVKWTLRLPSSSPDVHLHRCRTKSDARSLLFQSSSTATASVQWVTRAQLHAHGCSSSLPLQNLNVSYQQLWYTRMHAWIWEDTTCSERKGWCKGRKLCRGLSARDMQLQHALVWQRAGIISKWFRNKKKVRRGSAFSLY